MDLLPGDLMIPGPIKIKQLQAVDLYCCSLCPSITVFISLFSFLFISTYYILYILVSALPFVVSPSRHSDSPFLLLSVGLTPPALGSRTVYPCV